MKVNQYIYDFISFLNLNVDDLNNNYGIDHLDEYHVWLQFNWEILFERRLTEVVRVEPIGFGVDFDELDTDKHKRYMLRNDKLTHRLSIVPIKAKSKITCVYSGQEVDLSKHKLEQFINVDSTDGYEVCSPFNGLLLESEDVEYHDNASFVHRYSVVSLKDIDFILEEL